MQIKDKKTYYAWADWVKAWGIFLVVLGHGIIPKDGFLFQWIFSFHMPLFFLLSGLLSSQKRFNVTLKSSFLSIIIPYLIINVICMVFELMRILINGIFSWGFLWNSISAIMLGINSDALDIRPVCHYSWFLITLFFIKIITSIFSNRYYLIILTIVSGFIGFMLSIRHIDTFIPVDSAFLALPFYSVGTMLRKYKDGLPQYTQVKWNLIALLVLTGASFLSSMNGNVDINYMSYGDNILLFYFNGIAISICVMVLMQNIKVIPLYIKTLAKGSVFIMGIHHIIYYWIILRFFMMVVPSVEHYPYMVSIIISIFTLVFLLPILKLFEKYFPAAIGYRKR